LLPSESYTHIFEINNKKPTFLSSNRRGATYCQHRFTVEIAAQDAGVRKTIFIASRQKRWQF
jgi:hypothetical protein